MRFNQFSYLSLPRNTILYEFKKYGFDFPSEMADKKMLETFLSRVFFTYQDINYPLSILAVDKETDFSDILSVRQKVDCRYFLHCSLSTPRFFLFG